MKKLFTLLALLVSLSAFAAGDTARMMEQFRKEQAAQSELQFAANNKDLIMFVGYDVTFMETFLEYLGNEYGFASFDQDIDKTYAITKGASAKGTINVKATLNADQKIQSVKITGEPSLMINLFLFYWPQKIHYLETDLKKKALARQVVRTDEIFFYWNSGKPYIEIKGTTPESLLY